MAGVPLWRLPLFFMKLSNLIFSFIACLCLVVFAVGCVFNSERTLNKSTVSSNKQNTVDSVNLITTNFVNQNVLRQALNTESEIIPQKPVAGVVNHHVLAADLQARFFKSLHNVEPDIKTFYIISPDHFSAGKGISCHYNNYKTAFGEVEINKSKLNILLEKGCVLMDGQNFSNEHGVGALLPYIKYYFPDAKVVPIFIHIDYPKNRLVKFGADLSNMITDDDFVVVSSDMSHYLTDEQARENDLQTKSWLANHEWKLLTNASDEYTDSAAGFAILQGLFNKDEVYFSELDYAVSTDYGADPKNTTSYITGFYFKQKASD